MHHSIGRCEKVEDRNKAEAEVTPELIVVRKGEELDTEPLAHYLHKRLEEAGGPLSVLQFAGGHANLTYLLRFPDREYVLRRPPMGPVAKSSHDMSREYRVLSVLHQAFPFAPRALLYCEDLSVIGAPFFVMERKKGTVVRNVVPPEFGSGQDPKTNQILSEVIIDTLVQFHGVDAGRVGLDDFGKPTGYMERQVHGWGERYERAKTKEIPLMKDLKCWLEDKMPPPQGPTLLHNDWRLDNMMLDHHDPSKVIAVFDWDMCTRGDPLADLGCLLSFWFEKGEGLGEMSAMPSQVPGFMTREEAIRRYGERSGRDVSKMDFYYVFGLYKMAVVVQQIYFRYARGQTKDDRFKLFGMGAELLMSLAWNCAESSTL